MKVTDKFENYTSGVYEEKSFLPIENHLVSLVGYGFDNQTGWEYWIVRNSWGQFWGENGFFRIRMHKNNLGIESYWTSGYPSYERVEESDFEAKNNEIIFESYLS